MIAEVVEGKGEAYIPSAWYTCSMGLKRCIKQSVVERWDSDVHLIMKLPLMCQSEVVRNVYVNAINIDGREFVVGFGGKFEPKFRRTHSPSIYDARMESYRRAVNFWDS